MILHVPNVLNGEQVARCREVIMQSKWVDGRVTAGHQSALVKNNLQLPKESTEAQELGDMIIAALERHPLFIAAALPCRVFPPIFNRYEVGMSLGTHLDNSVRQIKGTPFRLRTDMAATLFLSQPDEYDGGELVIDDVYGAHAAKLPAGEMVLYPATSLPRVTPVVRGTRLASIFWVQSMVRDEYHRRLLFELDMAINQVNQALPNHAAVVALTKQALKRGAPMNGCFSWRRHGRAVSMHRSRCGSTEALPADGPEWFELLQTHVIAVQSNDRAVQLFREGRLDDAIAELGRGLEVSPQYATGQSNLGFLHLRRGQLDQAIACLLRALEVDPHHQDAPDHLVDVLSALIDELVQIGCSDGFLSAQPGGQFDDANRHTRARAIGALIAKIGRGGIFKAGGRPLTSDLLMEIVINNIAQKMTDPREAVSLKAVWSSIG